jgi:hypothetical protein
MNDEIRIVDVDEAVEIVKQYLLDNWSGFKEGLFEAFEADTTKKSYELLERVQKFSGKLGCPRLYFPRGDTFLDLSSSENYYITADVLKEIVVAMRNLLPDSEVLVSYQSIAFETGSALTRFASEMQIDLKDKSIKQESQGRAA